MVPNEVAREAWCQPPDDRDQGAEVGVPKSERRGGFGGAKGVGTQ